MSRSISAKPLIDFYGNFLTGNISVGTPAQTLQVGFDLFSSDVWVVSSECVESSWISNSSSAYQRTFFNQTASSTYSNQSSHFRDSLFHATGTWSTDQFNISGLGNSNVSFGLVDSFGSSFPYVPLAGVVGLAWPELSSQNKTAALDAIVDQLDSPVFSIFLERKANLSQPTSKGVITFGKHDDVNCSRAVLFSFYSFLIGPENYVDWIVNATNAEFVDTYGLYSVNCSSSTLPDIVFTAGDRDFAIPPNNYLMQMDTDQSRCFLLVVAANLGDLGIQWVLGAPFLRSFCTAYNFSGNGTISFANTKY
uniref:Peptidase A1 domain-containing protein n=1 Tax=Ditylenchus dipsaci TaxID=166011 RepID=A0A915DPB4_9BILA